MNYLGSYIVDKYGELIKGVDYKINNTTDSVKSLMSTNFTLNTTIL